MDQRFELRSHDEVDEEDGKNQCELHGVERRLHFLTLAGNDGRNAFRHRNAGDDRPGFSGGGAQVAVTQVGRDDCDAFLRDSPDFRGSLCDANVGDRCERYGTIGIGIDDEAPDLVNARGERVNAAYKYVDFLVPPGVACCDFAANIRNDAVGNIAYGESEFCGTLLVENNLDLRVAALDRGTYVGESFACRHLLHDDIGNGCEPIQVVARNFNLQGACE